MRKNQTTFTTRRGTSSLSSSATWTRNYETSTKHTRGFGKISSIAIVGMLTIAIGLIYVSLGSKATHFDYEISNIEEDIAELKIQKEDLANEQARLTSLATASTSDVAVSMEDSTVSGYVSE